MSDRVHGESISPQPYPIIDGVEFGYEQNGHSDTSHHEDSHAANDELLLVQVTEEDDNQPHQQRGECGVAASAKAWREDDSDWMY